MDRLAEIKAAIERLPADDVWQLHEWIADLCWEEWDREIEEDAKAGRLDKLVEQAMADLRSGKCKPLRCQRADAPSLRERVPFNAGAPVQTIRNNDELLED
jgi:hypothetical protein